MKDLLPSSVEFPSKKIAFIRLFPLRLYAESSSRPLTPSPPSKREAGELKLPSSMRFQSRDYFVFYPVFFILSMHISSK